MTKKDSGVIHFLAIILVVIVIILIAFFLFPNKRDRSTFSPPDSRPKKSSSEICLTEKEHAKVSSDAPKISIPFDKENFTGERWGFIPYCAHLKFVDELHNAFDFQLKPNSPVYASADGKIDNIVEIKEQGARIGLKIIGDGFTLDYSGLGNVQVKNGDQVKRRDLIAYTQETPFGEHHVHLGIFIGNEAKCPIQYLDSEFRSALDEILPSSDWSNYTDAPCACNCETIIPEEN